MKIENNGYGTFWAAVTRGEYVYYAGFMDGEICKWNPRTDEWLFVASDYSLNGIKYNLAINLDEEIWFIPALGDNRICVLRCDDETLSYFDIPSTKGNDSWYFMSYHVVDKIVYLIPHAFGEIVAIDSGTHEIITRISVSGLYTNSIRVKDEILMCPYAAGWILGFDIKKGILKERFNVSSKIKYARVIDIGDKGVFVPEDAKEDTIIYEKRTDCFRKVHITGQNEGMIYGACAYDGNNLYVTSVSPFDSILSIDTEMWCIKKIYMIKKEDGNNKNANYVFDTCNDELILIMPMTPGYPLLQFLNDEFTFKKMKYPQNRLDRFLDFVVSQ